MPLLSIDGRQIIVEAGATILDAARQLGIEIPALCHRPGAGPPCASCLVCAVKLAGQERLVPSCAFPVQDGMVVESETSAVHEARRTALELLLSDHVGDCMSPCHRICPMSLNIPRMLRQIAADDLPAAIATVRAEMSLPGVLSRLCHQPCEGGCRRAGHDSAVSVRQLVAHVVSTDLATGGPHLSPVQPANRRCVAIVGTGATGLSAAYFLQRQGYPCTLFDSHAEPGGDLVDAVPSAVLAADIDIIRSLGAVFRTGVRVGVDLAMNELRRDYDAVLIATGTGAAAQAEHFGLPADDKGIAADHHSFSTTTDGVFAAGGAVRGKTLIVRAAAAGKHAAVSIQQYLAGLPVLGPHKPFSSVVGKLADGEIDRFTTDIVEAPRLEDAEPAAISAEAARQEAARCVHCDCRKADTCQLRQLAHSYGADPKRFHSERRLFEQNSEHPFVVYEPGKCIACGRCVAIASTAQEDLGLTFVGRGFDVRVGVPFNESLADGLRAVAVECAEACPTGALSLKFEDAKTSDDRAT